MRKERLELSRVSPLGPKPSASTSSATFARAVPPDGPDAPTPVGLRRGAAIIADTRPTVLDGPRLCARAATIALPAPDPYFRCTASLASTLAIR